jgi:phage terminase large subunit
MEEQQPLTLSFKDTTATRKIFKMSKRIRAVAGGTSASKTISILVWLINYCQVRQNKPKICHVVSESFPHLETGAMLDFQTIMKDRGYWKDDLWHDTHHEYTFETGNKLRFMSVDTYGKAHGPRRDVLFVNEANNLDYKIVDQLITRTREIVWLDWNPSEEFWFYTEMQPNRNDVDFITLTYKDNEALDAVTVAEIESHRNNKAWWQVYGLGQLGEIETRIYRGWRLDLDEIPYGAKLERYWIDFGYSNDPTSIGALYYYDGGYIVDEIIYQKGLLNKQIADILNAQEQKALTIADSAEPKSIDEIRLYGVTILPAIKGAGSITKGIQLVQGKKISVTKRSTNIIKEYRNYVWITDKDGRIINEPMDINNHAMDGIRYAFNSMIGNDMKAKQFIPNHNSARKGYFNPVKRSII